jgi:hypothetical protein
MPASLNLLGTVGRAQPLALRTRGLQSKEVELAQGPKDEDDPTQLRRFAKRIAEMKWWNDNTSEKPAEAHDQGEQAGESQAPSEDQQPPTRDEEQPTTDDGPSSNGEASQTDETK